MVSIMIISDVLISLGDHGLLEPSTTKSFLLGVWFGAGITILIIAAIKVGIEVRKLNKETEAEAPQRDAGMDGY